MDSPQTLFIERWMKEFPSTILDSNFVNMIHEVINYAEKQAYNQAIDDTLDTTWIDDYGNELTNEESILKLKRL